MLDVTDEYNNECYNNFYAKSIDWDAYYEHLEDEWEDNDNEQ